jgi:DHA1 family tetracycline resistance protein-like MFS transporter
MSLGFIIGPAIGGLLGGQDPRLPFFVAAGMPLLNSIFGFFVLKETLAPENRRKFDWWRANPLGALKVVSRFPRALSLIAVFVLVRLANNASPSVFAFYCYLKFHWTTAQVGAALMFSGVCLAVVFSFGVRFAIKRVGEINSAVIGIVASMFAFTGYAFATQGWQIYVWTLVGTLIALVLPVINAMMSKQVGRASRANCRARCRASEA